MTRVARRVVARWRALVAERKACPLLDLLERYPELFAVEVLQRLDPTDRNVLAQVGTACRAAVLASCLPRLPKFPTVGLSSSKFCTSVERLAWAKANGCHWGLPATDSPWSNNPRATASPDWFLDAARWARQHWHNPCALAARGGHLEVL
jgi:hypothetical protein